MTITAVTHSKEVWELLAENESLRQQLAEQKETIERINKSASNRLYGLRKCWIERDEQSALIEKLTEALQNVEGALLVPHNGSAYHSLSINEYGRCIEALAIYNDWKGN